MRIFDKDSGSWFMKTNFADENNVIVGFEMARSCCESFGWFLTYDEPRDGIDNDKFPSDANSINPDGYLFDINYFNQPKPKLEYLEEGGIAVFKLTKKEYPDVFLVLHNSHNGYYSHGFQVSVGGKDIYGGAL